MKRVLAIIALLAALAMLPAATITSVADRAMHIGGFYNESVSINVDPISSTGHEGMPFDLLGSDVAAGSTGRAVATWAALSNTSNAVVEVSASHMTNTQTTSEDLPYKLIFQYSVAGSSRTVSSEVYSGDSTGQIEIVSPSSTLAAEGKIIFVLTSTAIKDNTKYPDGYYSADVKLTIKGE